MAEEDCSIPFVLSILSPFVLFPIREKVKTKTKTEEAVFLDERLNRALFHPSVVCVYFSFGTAQDPNGCEKRTNIRRVRLRLLSPAPDPNGCERTTNIRRVRLRLLSPAPDSNGCERTTNIRRVGLRLLSPAPDPNGCEKRTTNIRRVRLLFLRYSAGSKWM